MSKKNHLSKLQKNLSFIIERTQKENPDTNNNDRMSIWKREREKDYDEGKIRMKIDVHALFSALVCAIAIIVN
jgi:hypothetical protein